MIKKSESVLVVGFNTRPLAYALNLAGYNVYAVDFFGDLDLYPNVKDYIIVTKELDSSYTYIKDKYSNYLAIFAIKMLKKYKNLDYLIIGSGLDDAFDERLSISDEIKENKLKIINANNSLETIKKARDLNFVHNLLSIKNYKYPRTISLDISKRNLENLEYPFILKKKTGSGGINTYKINNKEDLSLFLKVQNVDSLNPSDWLIQEYIKGLPVSCTVISNGNECEVISINRQIIGFKFLNAPKKFMYCGNIVPANLLREDNNLISEISIFLAEKLKLKGINGFDFVLRDHYPYLMEINPRIPGSISASETALNLNLLKLHIDCFNEKKWNSVKMLLNTSKARVFATKLIMFAPKDIKQKNIEKINRVEYIFDKTEPSRDVLKNEPVCSILYHNKDFSSSYFGALKIADQIKNIMDFEY